MTRKNTILCAYFLNQLENKDDDIRAGSTTVETYEFTSCK